MAEKNHRDDETPEVDFLSLAERMFGARGLAAPVEAEQHQKLIARIGNRMDSFREHCRTSGDSGRNQLARGNDEVSSRRSVYLGRLLAGSRHLVPRRWSGAA